MFNHGAEGRKAGGQGCSRGSSADLSQLYAWLHMLTLTMTRQRGDISRPAGARLYGHVHAHAHAHAGIYSGSYVYTCSYSMFVCSGRNRKFEYWMYFFIYNTFLSCV